MPYFDQPLAYALQPLADACGLTYGTWAFFKLYDSIVGFPPGLSIVSYMGWANAASAIVWWLLPDFAIFAPVLNLGINGFTEVWMWVSPHVSGAPWNIYWYIHSFAYVAVALDTFTLVTYFMADGNDDMAEDSDDDWEEPTTCDPYDYYCY